MMNGSRTRLAGVLAPVLVAFVRSVSAQLVSGRLTGNVVDDTGAAIAGAEVTLTNEASKAVRRTRSNAEGFFTFAAVPPGTYTVLLEMTGFRKTEKTGVQIRVGDS